MTPDKQYVEVLRKVTDDGMYCVLICALDAPEGTVVAGNPNLRLAKVLREAADSILEHAPIGHREDR